MNNLMNQMLIFLTMLLAVTSVSAQTFDQRPDVRRFIDQLAKEQQFDTGYLKQVFAGVEPQAKIIEAITRPAEAMSWARYRKIFMTDARIQAGKSFMREHARTLAELEQRTGVPKAIIAAILGVETFYGQRMGSYRVIDALATLGFDYPKRSSFFLGELKQFLRLVREQHLDPYQPKGSYAGAMGWPQFMPSSYLAYAADYEGDGQKDIWNNPADAAASIANYLKVHRWQAGRPVAFPVSARGQGYQNALTKELKSPKTPVTKLAALGVAVPDRLPKDTPVNLLRLDGEVGDELWLTLENFYVITRYNHSPLYAMAVFQLSQALAE